MSDAWFIPILNLFRPWKMTKEIWRGSSPNGRDGFEQDIPRPVRGWFFIGLAGGAISQGVDITETGSSLRWGVAALLLSVVSGVCGIWMIQKVSERQERRRALTVEG